MYAHLLGAAPTALIGELNAIAEATVPVPDGPDRWRLRYNSKGVDGLRRLVTGWNVNRRLLDLAILVDAIERCHGAGALDFFFSTRSFTSEDGIARAVADACRQSSPEGQHMVVGPKRRRRLVSRYGAEYEHVPLWNRDVLILPPLFELLYVIQPDSMTRDCEALGEDGIGADDVRNVAGRWQRRMYHWLREITGAPAEDPDPLALLTQTRARHFTYMARWLQTDAGMGGAHDEIIPLSELLDDERVLAFWRAHWPDGSAGEAPDAVPDGHAQDDTESVNESKRYRSFSLVAELFVHLGIATDDGMAKMSPHLSIMVRAGEEEDYAVSEDALDPSDVAWDAGAESPLRAFESPPLAAVKFLKNLEIGALKPVASAGAVAHRLPLTLLRSDVFGGHQRLLGRAAGQRERFARLLAGERLHTYDSWVENFRNLDARLSTLRGCCLHVLVHLRSPHAVGRIRDALPDLACWNDIDAPFAGATAPPGASDAEGVLAAYSEAFFRSLQSTQRRPPSLDKSLDKYLDQLAVAFRRVNTQGFSELPEAGTQLHGIDAADVYARGDRVLEALAEVVEDFLQTLDKRYGKEEGLRKKFAFDLAVFQEGFTRIYAGGGSV